MPKLLEKGSLTVFSTLDKSLRRLSIPVGSTTTGRQRPGHARGVGKQVTSNANQKQVVAFAKMLNCWDFCSVALLLIIISLLLALALAVAAALVLLVPCSDSCFVAPLPCSARPRSFMEENKLKAACQCPASQALGRSPVSSGLSSVISFANFPLVESVFAPEAL